MCDNYARILSKIVVAQISGSFGFHSITNSAVESLADVLKLYIEEIGTRSHEYSELSCRTDSNFYDVNQTLYDMGLNLTELQQFLLQADEIPFSRPIPPFPLAGVEKESTTQTTNNNHHNNNNNNTEVKERILPPHIPSFLPDFPENHTYSKSPLYGEVITNAHSLHKQKNKHKRKIEESLIKLTEITTTDKTTNYDTKQLKEQNNNNFNNINSNDISNSSSNSNMNNNNNINSNGNGNGEHSHLQPDIIQPTPLGEINSAYFHKPEDDIKKHEEPPRRALLSEEDAERAKKKLKCDKILSLTHESSTVIDEDKDKENVTETH
ncbi:hypothetical protein DLAC_05986 [Tieghemostelium lacteum]|uniref:Transcription initiation factor TFIID subunit 8 n=1 Tax=Tieghemostelium lacteum TaxID=361077 RepID=A0A151ZH54_TIELA|nr:hypothetical protein DLAC_05986 [Tieghemostelium lacteum]|eukprot:KYQ93318.1 hypothetical protein DLAC_05986 [Tieghemostelium lacteum]